MSTDICAPSPDDPFDVARQRILAHYGHTTIVDRSALAPYLHDPVGWARDCVLWPVGESLTDYQTEILAALPERRRVAVRGPHGLGKTADAALAVLWFATTRDAARVDWKVVTTAGGERQLKEYLWPEIHKWAHRLRPDRLGRAPFDQRQELLKLHLHLRYGQAFAVTSDDPALIEGAHADHLLYVFDEAKAISDGTWDAAEGAFSGATGSREAFALAISTPGPPSGRFYDIHARKRGYADWWTRHVTIDEVLKANRVGENWVEQRRQQWGEASATFANRVLGEFHADDSDGTIPLGWVEAAIERWRAWDDAGRPEPIGRRVVGVDVAREGDDKTVLAIRQGHVCQELRVAAKQDTMATVGQVGGVLRTPHAIAVVDTDGLGAGVTDRLRERELRVVAFHAGAGTKRTDRSGELGFVNVRSAAWWNLREMLDPASGEQVALPPDDELIGELTAPKWRVTSGSRIEVERRDAIVKRLSRSPDRASAVVHAFWVSARPQDTDFAVSRYDGMPEFENTAPSW